MKIFPASKPDKKGFVRLYIYCSIQNTPTWLATKVKVLSETWNQEKQVITSGMIGYKDLNVLLTKRKGQLAKVFEELEYENIKPTRAIVLERYNKALQGKKAKAATLELLDYFDLYVKERENIRTVKGYLSKFKFVKRWLVDFKPDVKFEDINLTFYNNWINHLYENELETNTVSGYVQKLKSVMSAAIIDPRTREHKISIDFKLFKNTYVKPKPFWLDWETDIKKLEDFKPLPEHLIYKQEFLFRCYTGLRHSDAFNLTRENFIRNREKIYLDFMSIKTRTDQNILLSDKAVAILKDWNFTPPRLHQADCNEKIKLICRAAKIKNKVQKVRYVGNRRKVQTLEKWQLVTTHVARRTFGRRWAERGGSLLNLSVYFGHSSVKQTQEYIGWTTEEVNKEMNELMN